MKIRMEERIQRIRIEKQNLISANERNFTAMERKTVELNALKIVVLRCKRQKDDEVSRKKRDRTIKKLLI